MELNYDAIIFDMDGTLLDTMRYWRFTTLEYLLAHQRPVRVKDLVRMQGTSSRKLLFEIAAREGFPIGSREEVVTELEGFMARHYQFDAKLKADVPEFLAKLQGMNIPMCVATGAPRAYAKIALGRLGILDHFEFVSDNYEYGTTKDRSEYFLMTAERLNTTPERCLVFEDALYAMESAKGAGCKVCAIAEETSAHLVGDIKTVADYFIEGYAELL